MVTSKTRLRPSKSYTHLSLSYHQFSSENKRLRETTLTLSARSKNTWKSPESTDYCGCIRHHETSDNTKCVCEWVTKIFPHLPMFFPYVLEDIHPIYLYVSLSIITRSYLLYISYLLSFQSPIKSLHSYLHTSVVLPSLCPTEVCIYLYDICHYYSRSFIAITYTAWRIQYFSLKY